MRIVVCGYIAACPTAAHFWHAASYVLGFRQLGHEVWLLEDSGDAPSGWDVAAGRRDDECRAGVRFLEREMAELGLGDRWAFRHVPSERYDGMDRSTLLDVLAQADVLVNVSCTTPMRAEYRRIPHRLAIDTDPVFTQVRIAHGELADVPDAHTRLFTFGRPPLPAQRHEWLPTRQPVALDRWAATFEAPARAAFTTVSSWRSEWAASWDGVQYGGKDASFPPYLGLPARAPVPLEIALGGRGRGDAAPLLREHGWNVTETPPRTRTSDAYRDYIASSAGEFSVAQHAYVAARSGWFSERTCCFLASGRPAVVQDTGFSDWLPTGEGLLSFSTPDEALAGLEQVASSWERHARAARRIAEEHFEAAAVCSALLDAL